MQVWLSYMSVKTKCVAFQNSKSTATFASTDTLLKTWIKIEKCSIQSNVNIYTDGLKSFDNCDSTLNSIQTLMREIKNGAQ